MTLPPPPTPSPMPTPTPTGTSGPPGDTRGLILTAVLAAIGLVSAAWLNATGHISPTLGALVLGAGLTPMLTLAATGRSSRPASIGLAAVGLAVIAVAGWQVARAPIHYLTPSWMLTPVNLALSFGSASVFLLGGLGLMLAGAGAARLSGRTVLATACTALVGLIAGGAGLWSAGFATAAAHRYRGGTYGAEWIVAGLLVIAGLATLAVAAGPAPAHTVTATRRGDRRPALVTILAVAVALAVGAAGVGAWWLTRRSDRIELSEAFPDPALRACVARQFDSASAISPDDAESLFHLECPHSGGAQITDLTGLVRLENLSRLDISGHSVMSLEPLREVRTLGSLKITGNQVSDLTPIAALPHLSDLGASSNRIKSLAPLSTATALDTVGLAHNLIEDTTPLAAATRLTELDLTDNPLRVIAPLGQLPNLSRLTLTHTGITDPGPLCARDAIGHLTLTDNKISDLRTLSGCRALTELWIGGNPLTDLSPLAQLPNLQGVDISGGSAGYAGRAALEAKGIFVGGGAK